MAKKKREYLTPHGKRHPVHAESLLNLADIHDQSAADLLHEYNSDLLITVQNMANLLRRLAKDIRAEGLRVQKIKR